MPTRVHHRAARLCAMVFIALIALPVTAPFQTVSLADLFGSGVHAGIGTDAHAPIASNTIDARVSTVPSPDDSGSQMIVVASATANLLADVIVRLDAPPEAFIRPARQHSSTVLRV